MNRFALLMLALGFLLAVALGGCSGNTDAKPQTAASPKPETAPEPSFQTLILGKWRSVGPSLEQVWEFKGSGIVSRTSTISGTVEKNEVIPKDQPITLWSISQSGKYRFVNDKLVHVALEEAKSGSVSTGADESDWELEKITPTEMVVKFKGSTTGTFTKVE